MSAIAVKAASASPTLPSVTPPRLKSASKSQMEGKNKKSSVEISDGENIDDLDSPRRLEDVELFDKPDVVRVISYINMLYV